MKYVVKFYFYNLTSEWYWIKEFYSNDIQKSISSYLLNKKLPFEESFDIKYKII